MASAENLLRWPGDVPDLPERSRRAKRVYDGIEFRLTKRLANHWS